LFSQWGIEEVPNVEEIWPSARRLTEFDALIAAGPTILDALPGGVCVCDHEGWIVGYNKEAVALWGREPSLDHRADQFCGSFRRYLPDGNPLPSEQCPMARAVSVGISTRNIEVVIERPNGERITTLVNVRALRDHQGNIQGAVNSFQDINSHKAVEEDFKRQAKDLEDFFENSAIALHIVNSAGIIIRANRAELALLGYSPDEYIGRHIAAFHADAPVIGDILQRLSSGGSLDKFPARLRAKDGSIRHVLITSNGRSNNGTFLNTRCFTTDVTDRYEAEKARRQSEERLAATYEAASVGIGEVDHTGRFLRVNDAICKIVGRSREELLGMSFVDYTHAEDREEDLRRYQEQVDGLSKNYALRKRAVKPDGTIVHLNVSSSAVRDVGGAHLYGVRIIQDVTAATHLEDQLRHSESHLRNLLQAIPAAVYTTDAEGVITFFNKAAVEMAGRTPSPGDKWCVTWRLYLPDGTPLPHDQCPMAVALKEDRPVRGAEALAERPDGTRIPFIPFPTPLHDAGGRLIGAINMLVDISDRKKAENRQKGLIDELNHRVKNTLATIQSLAKQTARHAPDTETFIRNFESRLQSLAQAHDLLSKRYWQDAPLDALVRDILAPLIGDAEQIDFSGPAIPVSPRVALCLTMTLNELATNAVKYGALSVPSGRLSVYWTLDETASPPMLNMEWKEKDGPSVRPPTRRGFGSRLMERCIERDLGGKFDLVFDTKGLACKISVGVEPQETLQTHSLV
jgi:PAS domain S-box-containing protein